MFPQFGQPLSGPQMPGFAQRQAPQQPQMPQYGQQLQGLLGSLFQGGQGFQNFMPQQDFVPQQSQMIQPWMRKLAAPFPQDTQNMMFRQWTGPQGGQ
jgi:hypothetical protein